MNNNKNIETDLIESIASSDLKMIGSDIGEIAIDSLLNDGVLKDIPVIGTIVNLYSTGVTISGKIFEKKILKFLYGLDEISLDKRADFISKLNQKPKFKKKVSEHLLILIDRIDDMDKSEILAQLFSKFILGKVDYEMFIRLSSVIDKSVVSDLNKLTDFNTLQSSSFTATSLENLGLVYTAVTSGGQTNQNLELINGNKYFISELGKLLLSTIEIKEKND
jgi:hypothetical protein|tara:strand:+ start:115 stop:777 length:663 start_codon:yes stop_codon:yes gene_type:complete